MAGQLTLLGECLDEQDRAVPWLARAHHLPASVTGRVESGLGCTTIR